MVAVGSYQDPKPPSLLNNAKNSQVSMASAWFHHKQTIRVLVKRGSAAAWYSYPQPLAPHCYMQQGPPIRYHFVLYLMALAMVTVYTTMLDGSRLRR